MQNQRKYLNPPIFGPGLTVLPPGLLKVVTYYKDDAGEIYLERTPVLALAVIPDWSSVPYEADYDGDRAYDAGAEEHLYSVRAVGLDYDGPPRYLSFIDDGSSVFTDSGFVGYDDGMFDDAFRLKAAHATEKANVRRAERRQAARASDGQEG